MRTVSIVAAMSLAVSLPLGAVLAQSTTSTSSTSTSGASADTSGQTIAAIVQADPQFSKLLSALTAADLTSTLASGEYTVFAPTNDAFNKIPAATLNALLADKTALKKVLLDHVVKGKLDSAGVVAAQSVEAVSGSKLTVMSSGGSVMIDNATVTKADIPASNGVIHVVDAVIMPGTTASGTSDTSASSSSGTSDTSSSGTSDTSGASGTSSTGTSDTSTTGTSGTSAP